MTQARNDLCDCGSGKKYKKCCGVSIPMVPSPVVARQNARQCGECRMCCQGWLAGKVLEHEMKPGTPCHFIRDAGCSIYERRPVEPCRTFVCGWLLPDSPFPEGFRPDKLGVIFVRIVWRERHAWILVPTGHDLDETFLAQMRQYSTNTGEPHMIKRVGKLLCFGSVEFQQDMLMKAERGENPW